MSRNKKTTSFDIALIQDSYVFNCLKKNKIESQTIFESWQRELSDIMKQKTKKHIEEASKNAQIVILQELHTTQYFCQSEETKYFEFAKDFNENVKFFSNIAKDCNIILVTSLFEQRVAGLYHNTSVVFEKDGSIAGKYRKMHIPDDPKFYEKFYFANGDLGFNPIKTSIGNLGVLICWDQWFPEAARLMALNGADILIYPTAIGWFDSDSEDEKKRQLDAWQTIQRGHAIANGLPLASVNRVGFEPDLTTKEQGIRFFGSSFICGTQGEILAQASCDKEEILYANIDLKKTKDTRDIWPFFRDRRIEHYSDLLKLYGN